MRWEILLLVVLIYASPAAAQPLDTQVQEIAARLRCPVCQNESVADSPAELAGQMRALIRQKLAAGESPDQIIAYFVSRYGEWILLEPPKRGVTWAVWIAPPAALLLGALVAASFLRRVVKRRSGPPPRNGTIPSGVREDRGDQVVDR